VFSHELAHARFRLAGVDQRRRAVAGDLDGEGGRVHSGQAPGIRLGGQALHHDDRIGGLGGPAPLADMRGIGDGLQLPEHVGTAKLMISMGAGIIRRLGVTHRVGVRVPRQNKVQMDVQRHPCAIQPGPPDSQPGHGPTWNPVRHRCLCTFARTYACVLT
jgi:hypothetical protein